MAELTTVPQITALEKSILRSVPTAQREYKALTDGWWLWHAPESFLQVIVAQRVAKETKHVVYIDASMRRIEREIGRGRGRPAKNAGQRPDILVWHKTSATLRAVIEIKRTASFQPIQADAKKMDQWLKRPQGPKTAYILAYSEAKGEKRTTTLRERFDKWETGTSWQRIGSIVHDDPDDPEWAWGIVLMRKDKSY